jgi:hypothetical protein
VLERLLRTLAIIASLLVLAGWGLFALDEARSASNQTQTEIAGRQAAPRVDPSPEEERAREAAHGDPRELVDDANDVLLSPSPPSGTAREAAGSGGPCPRCSRSWSTGWAWASSPGWRPGAARGAASSGSAAPEARG